MTNTTLEKWEEKSIKQLAVLIRDGDWIETKNQSFNGIRLIQTGNIGEGCYKDKTENARYISEETFKKLNCTEIFSGDCLVSRLPQPLGRACIIPYKNERMITAVDCSIIRFNNKVITPKYFIYYSMSDSYNKKVTALSTGATRQRISRKNLETITIPLPPLPEQERIVAKLDKSFEEIDKIKANAEKNLNNAKELFDGYLENIVAPKDKLGKYIKITTGKLNSNAAVENGQYPFFTCSRTPLKINNFAFDCEAILLAGNNASGDFNVKHYKGKFNAYQRTYVITIPDKSKLNYRYLYFQLFKALAELKKMSLGANTKFLRVGMITDFMLSMPTIEEQQKIVEKLDALQEQTKQLEAIYTKKIKDLDELKQSILQKAFRGEL